MQWNTQSTFLLGVFPLAIIEGPLWGLSHYCSFGRAFEVGCDKVLSFIYYIIEGVEVSFVIKFSRPYLRVLRFSYIQ